jgi:hypothetical protein
MMSWNAGEQATIQACKQAMDSLLTYLLLLTYLRWGWGGVYPVELERYIYPFELGGFYAVHLTNLEDNIPLPWRIYLVDFLWDVGNQLVGLGGMG